jgi:molybdate transport system substrate-binding protein
VATIAACGTNGDESGKTGESPETTLLAAASLTTVVESLADTAGMPLKLSFGPSSGLVEQIKAGAPADVLATANKATMDAAVANGSIDGEPILFAKNTLVLAIPAGNPGDVGSIADLARKGLRVALCDAKVPCGSAAQQVLSEADVDASVDTFTTDVAQATALVTLGEVDAALIYRTDANAAEDRLQVIDVPDAAGVTNEYYIGVVAEAGNPDGAKALINQITGAQGRDVLAKAGFELP